MTIGKIKIVLTQVLAGKEAQASYLVRKLTNTTEPHVGKELKKKEVQELIDKGYCVIITQNQ